MSHVHPHTSLRPELPRTIEPARRVRLRRKFLYEIEFFAIDDVMTSPAAVSEPALAPALERLVRSAANGWVVERYTR